MKKASLLLVILVIMLAGCGKDNNQTDKTNQGVSPAKGAVTSGSKEASKPDGYVFEIKGVPIAMHAKAAPILEQLDGPKDYFESEACAFPGLEKVYQFNAFDLYTYELDGVDYIASVVLFDDTVATKEGVHLFDKKDNVLTAYGDGYANTLNLYTYTQGTSQLLFVIENDEVTSIEYLGTLDGMASNL